MTIRWHHQRSRATLDALFEWLIIALAGCGKPEADLSRMAAAGAIDDAAPVTAHVQVETHVPAEWVWDVLVGLPSWPKWQRSLTSVNGSPLSLGSSFNWTKGDITNRSKVQLLEPPHRLRWTGKTYAARAIHVWTLTAVAPDPTRVAVDESLAGPLIEDLFSSRRLEEADKEWVEALSGRQKETDSPSDPNSG